jgi:hypothetical protein
MHASGPSARVWATALTLDELRERHADEPQQILSKAIKIIEDSADSGDLPAINSKLLYSARVPTLGDLSKKAQMVGSAVARALLRTAAWPIRSPPV